MKWVDGEESGAAFFKPSCYSCLCQVWKFEFIFGSRFALIGPLVLLQGSRSCHMMKMIWHNFLIVHHRPGSFFSVLFAHPTPPWESSVSSVHNLYRGHFNHTQGYALFLQTSYFSVSISRPNLCSEHSSHIFSPGPSQMYFPVCSPPLARLVLKTLQWVLIVGRIKSKILNMPTWACMTASYLPLWLHLLVLCPETLSSDGLSSSPPQSLKFTIPPFWNVPTQYFRAQLNVAFSRGPSLIP